MDYSAHKERHAFSLVELLAVIGALALLLSILIPAAQMARETARLASCLSNEHEVSLALHGFEGTYRQLPPTITFEHDFLLLFWQARALPFLEQAALLDEISWQIKSGGHAYFIPHRRKVVASLQCVSNPDKGFLIRPDNGALFAFTDYCGVAGSRNDDGVFRLSVREKKGIRFSEVTGGLSNCLLFGERPPSDLDEGFGPWLGGQSTLAASINTNSVSNDFPKRLLLPCGARSDLSFQIGKRGDRCDWTHHWSFHNGGANFAKVDGSALFLSYDIDRQVLADLASRE